MAPKTIVHRRPTAAGKPTAKRAAAAKTVAKTDAKQKAKAQANPPAVAKVFQLFIMTLQGKTITVDVKGTDTIGNVLLRAGYEDCVYGFMLSGVRLNNLLTLDSVGIEADGPPDRRMVLMFGGTHLIVKDLSAGTEGRRAILDVERIDTIDTVKGKIQDIWGFPLAQQRLFFKGRELMNGGHDLLRCNVVNDCKLILLLHPALATPDPGVQQ